MPRIEQKLIDAGSDMERALADVRGRFVAKLGNPLQCEFEKFKGWLQAYVDPGGKLLGNCNIRAKALGPVLSKAGENYSMLASKMSVIGKSIEEKWASVETALNKGQAIVIEGRGTEVAGEKSNFAEFKSFHAFVLLQVVEDEAKKKWFVGFDSDVSATTETKELWNSLVRAAFDNSNEEISKLNDRVKDLGPGKLHEILKTMILGTTATGFGPLVRRYAIDTTKALEPPFRG